MVKDEFHEEVIQICSSYDVIPLTIVKTDNSVTVKLLDDSDFGVYSLTAPIGDNTLDILKMLIFKEKTRC